MMGNGIAFFSVTLASALTFHMTFASETCWGKNNPKAPVSCRFNCWKLLL